MTYPPHIIIGFSRKTHWLAPFSWAIRLTQWTPYSHVYARYKDPITGVWMVYQAAEGMTHLVPWDGFRQKQTIIHEAPVAVAADIWPILLRLMQRHLGVPYGWIQAIKMWWLDLWASDAPLRDGYESMVCSEAIVYILMLLGYEVSREPDRMTPKHIWRLLWPTKTGDE